MSRIAFMTTIFLSALCLCGPGDGRAGQPDQTKSPAPVCIKKKAIPGPRSGAVSMPLTLAEGADKDPKKDEYDALKEDLQALMEELKKLEKDAREKVKKEIIPLLKREIEKLRKWLREFEPGKDPPEKKKSKDNDYRKT